MAITGSIPLAIVAFIVTEIVVLKLADITAPKIQEAYGLDGVAIPHGNAIVFAPVGMAVNWVVEKIPFLAKIDWSPEAIENKFGKAVQPWVIGFVLGIIFGIVGGQGFDGTLMLAISTASFMIIFRASRTRSSRHHARCGWYARALRQALQPRAQHRPRCSDPRR